VPATPLPRAPKVKSESTYLPLESLSRMQVRPRHHGVCGSVVRRGNGVVARVVQSFQQHTVAYVAKCVRCSMETAVLLLQAFGWDRQKVLKVARHLCLSSAL
jgi:hypothetical protein